MLMTLFALLLLVPVGMISAQTINEDHDAKIDLDDVIPDDDTVGPVGIIDELYQAHSIVTDIMTTYQKTLVDEGFVDNEVYLEVTYVDEENEKLVIWLDPVHLIDPVDVDDLHDELGIDVPVEIRYGFFVPESHTPNHPSCPSGASALVCYYWDRYVNECLPTATSNNCQQFAGVITSLGFTPPTSSGPAPPADSDGDGINDNVDQCDTQRENFNGYQDNDGCPDTVPTAPSPPTPTPPTQTPVSGGIIFQDDFENGFSKWRESGQLEWQIGTLDEYRLIPGYTSSNLVAEADDCDDEACILSMRTSIDLSSYTSATLEFDRFVDNALDYREYLAVEVGNRGTYTEVLRWTHGSGDDDVWHHETVNLEPYLASGFNVRFVTEESSSAEDVGIDNVMIRAESSRPAECVLTITAQLQTNGSILSQWNDCEDIKRYKAYYSENGGRDRYQGAIYGTSYTLTNPNEGSSYVIAVRAQYESSNLYTERFRSNVVEIPTVDRTRPVITVPADITLDATSNRGAVVTYVATAYDAVDSTVPVTCNPTSGSNFDVGPTTVTCTARDSSGNIASATFNVLVNEYAPPDSDSDGIPDSVDQCPNQEGTTANNGCPTSTIPTINAGQAHSFRYDDVTNNERGFVGGPGGTIGFVGVHGNGERGFIGAGHTFKIDNPVQTYSHYYDGIVVSHETPLSPYTKYGETSRSAIDSAWVTVHPDNATISNHIERQDGQLWDIVQGSRADAVAGTSIDLSGAYTNSEGTLLYSNATVYLHYISGPNFHVDDFFIGHYTSVKGDSGAPVTTFGADRKLIGTHTGTLCQFSLPPDNEIVDVWSIFNGTSSQADKQERVCGDLAMRLQHLPHSNITSTSWYYKVIVPWDLTKSEFGLP